MESPLKHLNHHNIFNVLLIAVLFTLGVNGSNDQCRTRKFAKSEKTSYMQFTKETVSQEYAIEGEFKNLHCCAKGYRSIEWFKDGKSYPWSSEDSSSLIVFPQAANQTIFTRKATKVDEGRYTCVLRNDTHKMEHQMMLKVLDSSPNVPLATFSPSNQFADVGGSARFFCEAFVGKKDLPDMSIEIRWYHVLDDNVIHPIIDEQQETVKREEEQIIGSYLTIPQVNMHHYGRYLCRVEMGNSQTHRLEMSAELINALPIATIRNTIFLNPYFLGSCAALVTVLLFFLLFRSYQTWRKYFISFHDNEMEILNMKTKHLTTPPVAPKVKKSSSNKHSSRHDDTKIMIDVI